MAIEKISVTNFVEFAAGFPVLDVRSPGEFAHAHIPGAYNLPLFTDEERKVVGTAYKQESREKAIKIGLRYFGIKMAQMVEETEEIYEQHFKIRKTIDARPKTVLVHCWRGGMRSAGVAWLLDLYGFKVFTLTGGYKSFRRWVLEQFEKQYPFHVIGGYTGSGKTDVLHQLKKKGACTIDFESLARHKGSAFGNLINAKQPSQEMFENDLAVGLNNALNFLQHKKAVEQSSQNVIWVEDESQRIGDINLPVNLYRHKQNCPLLFLDVPFEARLKYIVKDYGKYDREKILNAVVRIKKRLGGLETKTAVNYLLEDDVENSFAVLLKYYDKWYAKCIEQRQDQESLVKHISCTAVNPTEIVQKIMEVMEKIPTCKTI